jgi:hypothetical protein
MLKPLIAAAGVAAAFGVIPVVTSTPAQACNPVPIPALGINADCGYAATQCGVAALTGIGGCAGGMPAVRPGAAGGGLPTIPAFAPPTPPPMNLPPNPVPVQLPAEPSQNFQTGQQCSNDPAFYASHSLSCPTMPGFTGPPPGMAPGQPNDPGVVGP